MEMQCVYFQAETVHNSFRTLSYDRSITSSRASSPHSATLYFLFQFPLINILLPSLLNSRLHPFYRHQNDYAVLSWNLHRRETFRVEQYKYAAWIALSLAVTRHTQRNVYLNSINKLFYCELIITTACHLDAYLACNGKQYSYIYIYIYICMYVYMYVQQIELVLKWIAYLVQ